MSPSKKERNRVVRLVASTFCHSTENPSKVRQALLNALSLENIKATSITESVVEGHYGNTIGILTYFSEGREAEEIFRRILCSMNRVDRNILKATLKNRVGSKPSHIHIRLSKQDAYLGKVVLMDGDDVIKVSATVKGVRKFDELMKYLEYIIQGC